MMTYQVRKRTYRVDNPNGMTFPNLAELDFEMMPLQPFGVEPGNGRTTIESVPSRLVLDLNTGWHTIESSQPLTPLNVTIDGHGLPQVEIRGNRLKAITHVSSLAQLDDQLQTIYFGYPILLSIEFGDPVTITKVYGKVGSTAFWWELTGWNMPVSATTQELQEQKAVDSWHRLSIISEPTRRRLIAALHYFHVAVRLTRVGTTPWEFMGEAILNYSKVLEALFPSEGQSQSIDSARRGLRELDYTEHEIERDFVPAISLRNEVDVGHVHLSVFSRTQLQVLHDYTGATEHTFRGLLQRVANKVQEGSYSIAPYTNAEASPRLINIVDRIAMNLKDEGKSTEEQ